MGVVFWYMRSICSRERPLVYTKGQRQNEMIRQREQTSGMHRKVKMIQQKQVEPQMKNTFDSRPADPGCLLTR